MNLVDWVLIGAVVVFALAGWHRGFVAGLLSFLGFLGGGLAAAFLLPHLFDAIGLSEVVRGFAIVFGVMAFAVGGQLLAATLGDSLSSGITWRPARLVDNLAGAALNVLALALVAWIVASALAYMPVSAVSRQMTQSRVLSALDAMVPAPARNVFDDLTNLVGTSEVPRLFTGFARITGPDVAEPDPDSVTSATMALSDSIVRVEGATPQCGGRVNGSGFFVSPDHVLTNAHVVAGVTEPEVFLPASGEALRAKVVYFDPRTDVAMLVVPDQRAQALKVARDSVETAAPAVIAGYPHGGPLRLDAARVRTVLTARGDDIYGHSGVDRQVYTLKGRVQPGNSGGPLLSPEGSVLGMVFGADLVDDSTGYALTADELRPAIAQAKGSTQAVDTGSCRIVD